MRSKKPNREYFNKKAQFDYELSDFVEAGIVLLGEEIKAIRSGRVNISGSHIRIMHGEVYWIGGDFNLAGDGQRTRKLLLHKNQIQSLVGKTMEKGMTLIPLKLYLKKGRAKLEIGLGKGRKNFDKRDLLKKRDQERDAAQRVKQF